MSQTIHRTPPRYRLSYARVLDLPPVIELEAIDPTRDILRRYEIEWSRDLFGDWIVTTRWGRIGRKLRTRVQAFQAEQAAREAILRHVRRRSSAPRRIGVPYRPIGAPPAAPRPILSTRLRHYLWIPGFDGWVEDEDAAILAVHPERERHPTSRVLAIARQIPTTYAWGLYDDGRHVAGRALFVSQFWAEDAIRERLGQEGAIGTMPPCPIAIALAGASASCPPAPATAGPAARDRHR